jgi:prevent-host-death family protein
MQYVSTSDLKNQLSRYLQKIRNGRSFLVTDHGTAVAAVVPLDQVTGGDPETKKQLLAAQGKIQLPTKKRVQRTLPKFKISGKLASAMIMGFDIFDPISKS